MLLGSPAYFCGFLGLNSPWMYLLSATKYLSIIFVFRLGSPKPKPYKIEELKSRILQPALTSHYLVWTEPTSSVSNWMVEKETALGDENLTTLESKENISISCSEASLPGSTFFTHDVMVYNGVAEKFAYMRSYDDRADFTFYVNAQYLQLKFFEAWMSYIAAEEYNKSEAARGGVTVSTYNYRMNFPVTYRQDIYITKFERNFGGLKNENKTTNVVGDRALTYVFKDAFPISMSSIPVSYDSSELLKCTVSFAYTRYYITPGALDKIDVRPAQPATQANYGEDIFGLA